MYLIILQLTHLGFLRHQMVHTTLEVSIQLGVTVNSSTQVQITVAASARTLYYYCSIHSGMGGQANTVDSDTWGMLQWNQNAWGRK